MGNDLYIRAEIPPSDFTLTGAITDTELSQPESSIKMLRDNFDTMWSTDPFNPTCVDKQVIAERPPVHLQRIVIVVDTSEKMRNLMPEIKTAINSLPADFDVKLVLAEVDGLYESGASQPLYVSGPAESSNRLEKATFVGAADNVPALRKAWDLAAEKPGNNVIVWIHHPQRLRLDSVDELGQRWTDRPYGPTLYSVAASSGTDEIERELDGINEVKSVARTADLSTDLKSLFARLTGSEKTLEFVRSSVKVDDAGLFKAIHTSDHLARLWANDEVARILAPRDSSLEDEAIKLASRYQLVTPVTGAVVLESERQYHANDLKPVDAGTVPTIPEPEMILLLIVAGGFWIWLVFMKYRKSGPGRCTV